MASAVEETVKALVDFESQLAGAKTEAAEAKRKAAKDSAGWAESAKAAAITKAQEIAAQRVESARREAEAEAGKIRKKGESDLKSFESSVSKHRAEAVRAVASMLLGEEG